MNEITNLQGTSHVHVSQDVDPDHSLLPPVQLRPQGLPHRLIDVTIFLRHFTTTILFDCQVETSTSSCTMVDSAVKPEVCVPEASDDVKPNTDYGANLMVIPATNQIKELQTIIRDK